MSPHASKSQAKRIAVQKGQPMEGDYEAAKVEPHRILEAAGVTVNDQTLYRTGDMSGSGDSEAWDWLIDGGGLVPVEYDWMVEVITNRLNLLGLGCYDDKDAEELARELAADFVGVSGE